MRVYLSLTVIIGTGANQRGWFRPLADVTPLMQIFYTNIFWFYAVSDQVRATKYRLTDTINRTLYDVHRRWSDGLAVVTGLDKIQFVGMG